MRIFLSVILGLITIMLMVFGLFFFSLGDFSSRGGSNIDSAFAWLGLAGIIGGVLTGIITAILVPKTDKRVFLLKFLLPLIILSILIPILLMLLPKLIQALNNHSEKLAAEEQQVLILNKDSQASSACVMDGCRNIATFLGKEQAAELRLLSCQTIQQKWSENPQPYQIILLMNAYLCLGDSVESRDIQEARKYWFKGLSYLQDDSVKSLVDHRSYTIDDKHEQSILNTVVALLGKIMTLDYKNKTCVYSTEVDHYLSSTKFSERDIKSAIDWGCSTRFSNDKERFFNGEFEPEDPDLFLKPLFKTMR